MLSQSKNNKNFFFQLERMKLFSSTSNDGSALRLGPTEYIKALFPHLNDEADTTPFKKLPLQEKIKEILIDGGYIKNFNT